MNKTWLQTSARLYGFLLSLYPKEFKQEFGAEMQYVFAETLKDTYKANGNPGVTTLWISTIRDAIKSVVVQHIESQKGHTPMQKSFLRVALATTVLLMIPFVGMQVGSEWNWTLSDFIIMGVLIAGTGLMIELVLNKVRNKTHRISLAVGLVLLFLFVWVELAVGIFTNLGS